MKDKVNQLLAEFSHLKRQVAEEEIRLQEAVEQIQFILQAQQICQEVAAAVQATAHKQIASIVSRCLQAVFGEDACEFRISFEEKRGKTEARLHFVRDGNEFEPMEEGSGGVLDVATFGLRLACLMLTRPQKRKLLCLDESFRMVSKEYIPRVKEMLLMLSKELGVQIILVTHQQALATGKVIEF